MVHFIAIDKSNKHFLLSVNFLLPNLHDSLRVRVSYMSSVLEARASLLFRHIRKLTLAEDLEAVMQQMRASDADCLRALRLIAAVLLCCLLFWSKFGQRYWMRQVCASAFGCVISTE